jgi:mRNA-degrading endonuclease RelE of RelBE toxin-antitoxin system
MAYELNFVEGIQEDFLDLDFTEPELVKIHDKLQVIANHPKPLLHTERVMNTELRKVPHGDHRIFLYIDEPNEVIYCLAIKHHNRCYKKREINQVLITLRKISQEEAKH